MDQQSESVSKNSTDESLCRLCLGHCSVCLSLFDNNATEMLEALTSIKLEPGDPFTTSVCSECLSDLSNAYATQQKIMQNQKHLENSLTELNIKKEAGDDVCGGTFDEENESDFTETMKQEIKMEVETNEEVYENEYCGSEKTNFIAETDYGHVEDDENQEDSDCDDFSQDVTVITPTTVATLPGKSKDQYAKAYKMFQQWCDQKGFGEITEDVLLEYFKEKSKTVKSSTLWANYSMVKTSLLANSSVDISKFTQVVTFLKGASKGYRAKKSKIFTREEIRKFLLEAPNETYLMMKVALILGIAGSCRRDELTNMSVDHIDDKGSSLVVTIPTTTTKLQRVFAVVDSGDRSISLLDIYRKYSALRPLGIHHQRFFIAYRRGRCSPQVVGVNAFGVIPRKIATWLNLPNPADYNGHCFRRSPPTLLLDLGTDFSKS